MSDVIDVEYKEVSSYTESEQKAYDKGYSDASKKAAGLINVLQSRCIVFSDGFLCKYFPMECKQRREQFRGDPNENSEIN